MAAMGCMTGKTGKQLSDRA